MSQDILEKVRVFLEAASKDAVEVSDDLIDQFGEACKESFRKQFTDQRNKEFGLRASNIGRPLCQLQMEKKGVKGEGQPYNAKMRNMFGDIVEQLAIIVMKAAGVDIQSEQKKIKYKPTKDIEINGALDVEIDNKVWDIKSASPWSFTNKFGENGGFTTVATDDVFGYTTQGYVYAEGASKPFGGWIVINKSTGEWALTETPLADDEYKDKAGFYYADVEDGGINTGSAAGIRGVPTVIIYKKGVEVDRKVGGVPESHMKEFLEKNI